MLLSSLYSDLVSLFLFSSLFSFGFVIILGIFVNDGPELLLSFVLLLIVVSSLVSFSIFSLFNSSFWITVFGIGTSTNKVPPLCFGIFLFFYNCYNY